MGLQCDCRQLELGIYFGVGMGYVPTFLAIVGVADLWTMAFDENCVKFAQYGMGSLCR